MSPVFPLSGSFDETRAILRRSCSPLGVDETKRTLMIGEGADSILREGRSLAAHGVEVETETNLI